MLADELQYSRYSTQQMQLDQMIQHKLFPGGAEKSTSPYIYMFVIYIYIYDPGPMTAPLTFLLCEHGVL